MMLRALAAILLVIGVARGIDDKVLEGVVDGILSRVDAKLTSTTGYTYEETVRLGSFSTVVKIVLTMGRVEATGLKRTSGVTYKLVDETRANFKFTSSLNLNINYSYWMYISTDRLSTGTVQGLWPLLVDFDLDVTSDKCSVILKSVKPDPGQKGLDLEAKPSDGTFTDVTWHLKPGYPLHLRLLSSVQSLLQTNLSTKTICDCINC